MRADDRDNPLFTRRAAIMGMGQLGLFALLAGRLYYLQIRQAEEYAILAEENRINIGLLPSLRGDIFDRFGQALATNRPNFQVVIIPEQTSDPRETLDMLNQLVPISASRRRRLNRDIARTRGFVSFTVAENLTWEDFSAVNVHSPHLPGVEPQVGERRFYPDKNAFSHIVGYVGRPDSGDLEDNEPLLRVPGFRIGKSGVEKKMDVALRGQTGSRRVEVNNVGRVIRELSRDPGTPGADIVLTLDAELQRRAMQRLGKQSGSVIVMDIHAGDILSLASSPSFDPNNFTLGISQKQWQRLIEDERKPLINKAVAGQYAPGSTIKMIVALAALEEGIISPNTKINCSGQYQLGEDVFHCWQEGGHGIVNLHNAIKHSCDVYFYELARRLGIESIARMARRFGLGSVTGLEIPGEQKGLVPDKDWKRATFESDWLIGESLLAGIGQGYFLTTPIQLTLMMARLVNGGKAVVPSLIYAVGDKVQPRFESADMGLNSAHLDIMHKAMKAVINDADGTAYFPQFNVNGEKFAGKTGTVQVRRITNAERQAGIIPNEKLDWHLRDHALFIGYAPLNNPKYAITVIIEHGGSGAKIAAPIARDLFQHVLREDPLSRDIVLPVADRGENI